MNKIFYLKKIIRYINLYGINRTIIKIKGRYHQDKHFNVYPKHKIATGNQKVGLIGCGNFSFTTIAYFLNKNYGKVIKSCMDIDLNRCISLFNEYGLSSYSNKASDIFDDKAIGLIFIASNHSSHSDYAIEALKSNKVVHIEKPHIVNKEQLRGLCNTIIDYNGKVNIGFNRPYSNFCEIIFRELNKQEGSLMLSWFVTGHKLERNHWYFNKNEGSRILGNLSHWIDLTFKMIPNEKKYPISITPVKNEFSDENIIVIYKFGDGSIASITFSAKGQPFEGVHERLNLQKGELILNMQDFSFMQFEDGKRKKTLRNFFRDQGHNETIKKSYRIFEGKEEPLSVNYVWEIGELMLKTKEALETNEITILETGFSIEKLH